MPLSIIATFISIYLAGFTLNLMTLGGLALGVGMLVDNAIVVIENIYRHLEHGEERALAARKGASEVAMAITASTFTTVVVFLPMMFSEGITAQLTRGMSLTIMFALISSLLVAITIIPMLASVFFKEHRRQESSRWFIPIRERYGNVLGWVLSNPWKTVFMVTAMLVLSLFAAYKYVGTEFMPEGDNSMFLLNVELPVGTPLEESSQISQQIKDLLLQYPEIESVGEAVGRDENDRGGDQAMVTGPHYIQMFVRTKEAKERERTIIEIQNLVRKRLPHLHDTRFTFQNMGMMGQSQKAVMVNVYGNSLETLEEICANVAAIMKSVDGLKDIETSFSKGRPEYRFYVDRQKALMYGLAPVQIQKALEAANLGKVATRLRTGEDEIDIRVILDEKYRSNLEWIKSMPLKTPTGTQIPLGQVVQVRQEEGPTVINRYNKYRVGTVDANLSGRALGKAVEELRQKLSKVDASLPDGYSVEFKGQFEDMQESFAQLGLGLILAILLVYMVMASQFESLMHPFIIMFTFPLAVIGVVWILLIAGKTFSVVTFVGIIILAGIAVNNGIVFIDYVNQLRQRGMAIRDALIEGGKTRMRPVIITAGTTICGMLPMALSQSEGSQMRSPMALTVIGGLISATFLTLFLIPVLYQALDGLAAKIKALFKKMLH
jgi:HAE1 family hydrophobic/amphiphilic exporter-1